MNEKKQYYAIDCMKFISALLVIGIHTGPFLDINMDVNFVFVQILGRIAVPFFFVASAFFFFKKIDFQERLKGKNNLHILKKYVLRLLKIYVIWSLAYIPLLAIGWMRGGVDLTTLIRLVRDFLFTGTYYHLWFLPALIFAVVFIYLLLFTWGFKMSGVMVVILYIIGMTGNIYAPVLEQIPIISTCFELYMKIFTTTRNGLFFGSVFVYLGAVIAKAKKTPKLWLSITGTIISFILLCMEAFGLKQYAYMHDLVSMYLMLVPFTYFMYQLLLVIPLKEKPIYTILRKMSLLIYVIHIYFVTFMNVLLPNNMHFTIYIGSVILSIGISLFILKGSPKLKLLKHLY